MGIGADLAVDSTFSAVSSSEASSTTIISRGGNRWANTDSNVAWINRELLYVGITTETGETDVRLMKVSSLPGLVFRRTNLLFHPPQFSDKRSWEKGNKPKCPDIGTEQTNLKRLSEVAVGFPK